MRFVYLTLYRLLRACGLARGEIVEQLELPLRFPRRRSR
jgi:hypothetical protein